MAAEVMVLITNMYAVVYISAYIQLYTKMVWLTIGCSVCYPLIWLFSEGFGNFSVSFEVRVVFVCKCTCLNILWPFLALWSPPNTHTGLPLSLLNTWFM